MPEQALSPGPARTPGLPDAALVVALAAGLAFLVGSPGYRPDPDSYYHVGCARLYAAEGWLDAFPWLPYTVLGPSFPNVHLLQHLLLAAPVALLPRSAALRVAPVLLAGALAASVVLVLRRWRVPRAGAWAALGLTGAPLLIVYAASVKGGALFFVAFVWYVEAVWAGSWRRALVLAWASVYAYVGAPVLLLVAAAHAAAEAAAGGRAWWRLPLATAGGLGGGMVVNPFWPSHLEHTARELLSAFSAAGPLAPGVFRGGEWLPLDWPAILWFAGAPVLAWTVLVVRAAARRQPPAAPAAAGALLCLALLGLSLASGTKLLHLFALASVLLVPLAATRGGPWPRGLVLAAALLAAANSAWSGVRAAPLVAGTLGPRPRDYEALGAWLAARAAPGEVVVAPWDDFPGLFFFDPGRRYVAGVNLEFLLRADPARGEAYLRLYRGTHPDPRLALRSFAGARYVVARRPGLDPAGGRLHEQLSRRADFEDAGAPKGAWTVFRAR